MKTGFVFWLLPLAISQAALLRPSDGTYSAVSAAVTAASAGDVVLMPEGTNNWGSSQITLTKKIYVCGMGRERTQLLCAVGGYRFLANAQSSGTNVYGYAHFTVHGGGIGGGATLGIGHSTAYPASLSNYNYRVHHIMWTNQNGRGMQVTGRSQGVVDHCKFHAATDVQQQGYTTYGLVQTIAVATTNVPVFGTYTDYPYVEDCSWNWAFDADGALDFYASARAVIRFNAFTNSNYMAVHNTPGSRAATQWEFYGNTLYGEAGSALVAISHIRSGTGLACSNSFTSAPGLAITSVGPRITDYRTAGTNVFAYYYPYTAVNTAPSPGDSGTSMVVAHGSRMSRPTPYSAVVWPEAEALYGNANAETIIVTGRSGDTLTIVRGSPARAIVVGDQIEAVINDSMSGTNRIDGNLNVTAAEFGYPGSDQIGWSDPQSITATNITQTSNPAYFWQNTHNGTNVPVVLQLFGTTATNWTNVGLTNSIAGAGVWVASNEDVLQENRDYYNSAKPGWTPPPYPHYLVSNLEITPATQTVHALGTIHFGSTTTDGSDNPLSTVKYYVMVRGSGSVGEESGVYTAPSTPGTEIVMAIDQNGNESEAVVTVDSGLEPPAVEGGTARGRMRRLR